MSQNTKFIGDVLFYIGAAVLALSYLVTIPNIITQAGCLGMIVGALISVVAARKGKA